MMVMVKPVDLILPAPQMCPAQTNPVNQSSLALQVQIRLQETRRTFSAMLLHLQTQLLNAASHKRRQLRGIIHHAKKIVDDSIYFYFDGYIGSQLVGVH